MSQQINITFLSSKYSEKAQSSLPMISGLSQESDLASGILKDKKQKGFIERKQKQRWNNTQNRRYINFLKKNLCLFQLSFQQKRKSKINVKMSKTIKTKNPAQCHSHHQKMMLKYGSLDEIIKQNIHLTQELIGIFGKKACMTLETKDHIDEASDKLAMLQDEQILPQNSDEDWWCGFIEKSFFQQPEHISEQQSE